MSREITRIYRPLTPESTLAINDTLEKFSETYDFIYPVFLPDTEYKITAVNRDTNRALAQAIGSKALFEALDMKDNKPENARVSEVSTYNLRRPGYGDQIYVNYAKFHQLQFWEVDKIGVGLELDNFIPEDLAKLYADNNIDIYPKSPGRFNVGCMRTDTSEETRDHALSDLEWRFNNLDVGLKIGELVFDTPPEARQRLSHSHTTANRRG